MASPSPRGLSSRTPARFPLAAWMLLVVASLAGTTRADDVLPGHDLWSTPANGGVEDFGGSIPAIPADFFSPGSEPFTGIVFFTGQPLGSYLGQPTGPADTIVRRNAIASFPTPAPVDIPIEIVALSLVSVNPITVTYNPPQPLTFWDIRITLSEIADSPGQMTITHDIPEGGTYSAQLNVCPLLTFTRVDNPLDVRTIDYCPEVNPAGQQIAISDQPWSHTATLPLVSPLSGPNFFVLGRSRHSGPHPDADPIEEGTPPHVPSLGALGVVAAALLLLGAAAFWLRRSARGAAA